MFGEENARAFQYRDEQQLKNVAFDMAQKHLGNDVLPIKAANRRRKKVVNAGKNRERERERERESERTTQLRRGIEPTKMLARAKFYICNPNILLVNLLGS